MGNMRFYAPPEEAYVIQYIAKAFSASPHSHSIVPGGLLV
jgi:hypothetical protein